MSTQLLTVTCLVVIEPNLFQEAALAIIQQLLELHMSRTHYKYTRWMVSHMQPLEVNTDECEVQV